jgi:type IV pilus assembly protein PilE
MRRKNQSGFVLLLEMMLVCLILLTLAAIATPSFVQMQRSQTQQAARKRVEQVAWVESTIALCALNPGCNSSAIVPLLPQQPSMQVGGYQFDFAVSGSNWTYTATPRVNRGTFAYFVDTSGVLRCDVLTATLASPICD